MPKNKNALIRYRVINRLLKNYSHVSLSKMAKACSDELDVSIAERTIRSDLKTMRDDVHLGYFAPIARSSEKKAYYYTDNEYSIDSMPLNENEINALKSSLAFLKNYDDVAIFKESTGAIEKVLFSVKANNANADGQSFVSMEKDIEGRGHEYLSCLLQLIQNKTVCAVHYRSFSNSQLRTFTIHPYHLKEHRNFWYVIGYSCEKQRMITLALDRIKQIEAMEATEYKPCTTNLSKYFNDVIGVTILDAPIEKVLLRFTALQAKYVLAKPIHPSQQLIAEYENKVDIAISVIPTFELEQLVLNWGSAVEVISPSSFREKIHMRIQEMLSHYQV